MLYVFTNAIFAICDYLVEIVYYVVKICTYVVKNIFYLCLTGAKNNDLLIK